jgi:hypothetical protein
MVHGQFLRGELAATPVAVPQRQPVLPPAAAPQITGFVPLALDLLLADVDNEMIQNKPPKIYIPTAPLYKRECSLLQLEPFQYVSIMFSNNGLTRSE